MRHVTMVRKGRMEYKKKQENAILFPEKFWSIIDNGIDQLPLGLPHFLTSSIVEQGTPLTARLIWRLGHNKPANLYHYTMKEERKVVANHILENIHRSTSGMAVSGSLPRALCFQIIQLYRRKQKSIHV